MESHVIQTLAFLLILLQVSDATTTPLKVFWNSVLPNTPMPRAIGELIPPGKPLRINVRYDPLARSNSGYNYPSSIEDGQKITRDVAVYLLEKDLQVGTKMNLYFTRTTTGATFLPRNVAESIPFASQDLFKVMKRFSIDPDSTIAYGMNKTLELCESMEKLNGEVKLCTTSLESMVDFVTSIMGTRVQPMSTELEKEETPKQQYIVAPGVKMVGGETSVVCHGLIYTYGVFFCHGIQPTNVYQVPMIGTDGTKAMAVAICHKNTTGWNPKHLSFQFLNVKPGTVPICHILLEDNVVWASK